MIEENWEMADDSTYSNTTVDAITCDKYIEYYLQDLEEL